jgi:uncharacterized membrane protein
MFGIGKRSRKHKSVWQRFRMDTRKRFISGLLVVVPLGITALILNFLYDFTAGFLEPLVAKIIHYHLPSSAVAGLSIIVLLGIVYTVGLVATLMLGRKLIALGEAILQHIPLVKSVYGASKQVVEALSFQNTGNNYTSAVLVNFPSKQAYSVGFLTGVVRINGRETPMFRVFIPTTPNPTTGFLILVEGDEVFRAGISVEDAVKTIMSGGIVSPDTMEMTPLSQIPLEDLLKKSENGDEVDEEPWEA